MPRPPFVDEELILMPRSELFRQKYGFTSNKMCFAQLQPYIHEFFNKIGTSLQPRIVNGRIVRAENPAQRNFSVALFRLTVKCLRAIERFELQCLKTDVFRLVCILLEYAKKVYIRFKPTDVAQPDVWETWENRKNFLNMNSKEREELKQNNNDTHIPLTSQDAFKLINQGIEFLETNKWKQNYILLDIDGARPFIIDQIDRRFGQYNESKPVPRSEKRKNQSEKKESPTPKRRRYNTVASNDDDDE